MRLGGRRLEALNQTLFPVSADRCSPLHWPSGVGVGMLEVCGQGRAGLRQVVPGVALTHL